MNEEETENTVPDKKPASQPEETERREFIAKAVSIVAGGAIVSIPVGTGLATLVAPLFKEGQGGVRIRLASVEDLPLGGPPKLYQVVAERTDAWTKYPEKPLGSVSCEGSKGGRSRPSTPAAPMPDAAWDTGPRKTSTTAPVTRVSSTSTDQGAIPA